MKFNSTNAPLLKFAESVLLVLDKHAPKNIYIRPKNYILMTWELRKAVINLSKLRNNLLKHKAG